MSEFMKREQFAQVAQDFFECYPNLKIKAKLERIYHVCKDLDSKSMTEVFNQIIDSSKGIPTPDEVRNSVNAWKRNYYMKHGHWYGHERDVSPGMENDCQKCNDLGVVRACHHDSDHNYLLFRCNCNHGKSNLAQLPEWDNNLGGAYKKTPCPLDWFKPELVEGEVQYGKLLDLFHKWKGRVQNSEKHWSDLGFPKRDLLK